MTFELSTELVLAQLQATIDFADDAAGNSVIKIYTEALPEAGDTPLATIVLDKPCGVIAGSSFSLIPDDPLGTLVTTSGIPHGARWEQSDGTLVARGSVTDVANGGDFTVNGGETPVGETSPQLYAGGLVLLGDVTLT